MGSTVAGGKKAAVTNRLRYGKDFYQRIGAVGGSKGFTGGFAANPRLASIVGAKGGYASRREGIRNLTEDDITAIREAISNRTAGIKQLADKYNVSYAVIRNIHIGKTYAKTFTGGCICYLCEMKRSPVA